MTVSMTGYGRGLKTTSEYSVTLDIRTVNHRYLDLNFRIPKNYGFIEDGLRRELSRILFRGKVDVMVSIESFSSAKSGIKLNRTMVETYLRAIEVLKTDFHLSGEADLGVILDLPEVLQSQQLEEDEAKVLEVVKQALKEALSNLLEMRQREGAKLAADLQQRLTFLSELRLKILELAPAVVSVYQEKLLKRIAELTENVEIDSNRIAMEVALFADRSDIHEELIRIESHLHQFLQTLSATGQVGKRLDFLIQELNREINTIGSKANELQITQIVIEFKSELEKLREQVQNIE